MDASASTTDSPTFDHVGFLRSIGALKVADEQIANPDDDSEILSSEEVDRRLKALRASK